MMSWKKLGLLAAVAACAVPVSGCPPSRLRTIYDQGDYGMSGLYSELRSIPSVGHAHQVADDFTLTRGSSTITQVRWWGAYVDNVPVDDDFTLRICADSGDGPEPGFAYEHHAGPVNRQATGDIALLGGSPRDVYLYSCEVPATSLDPGTRYFLVILNDTGKWAWLFNSSDTQGDSVHYYRNSTSGEWESFWDDDMAFQLRSNRR